jgi:KDO2-lipid IV(A) lauroyltransferase
MTLVSKLAHKSGAPAVIAYASRKGVGRGFEIIFKPVDSNLGHHEPVVALKTLNLAVESCVREAPEQYMWSYRRFRKRPAGEPERYLKKKSSH